MTQRQNIIKVKELSKSFSDKGHALRNINLQICKGEIYGIIGMSGAGKSTLIRCLTGLEKPTSGSIHIDGQEITNKAEHELTSIRRNIGMVFQHFYLFSSRTVAENIAYPLEIFNMPKHEQKKRVDELLNLVGLEDKRDSYPSRLSGGEKQRVGIARALANSPHILLCDEATSALDPKTTRSILQLLQKLNQTLGLTIVVITHQLEVVKQICSRVGVLYHGELVEDGSITDVFTRPKHSVTQHLLHLSPDQLPDDFLKQRDPKKMLIRLSFEGQLAKEPIISRMIKRFNVDANILLGNLDCVQKTIIGNLILELEGVPEEMEMALNFLRENHINCEKIG